MPINQNLPSLRQLQYLVALSRTRSFSRAAETCNVTQSTFSAGITALEAQLDAQLVSRNTRNVSFTSLGQDVLAKAQNLLSLATEITFATKEAGGPLSGTLRLGVIPTIAPYLLPRILPALRKDWPKLQLNLQEDLTGRLLAQLENGQLDVALMAFPYDTPKLQQRILFSEEFVLASTIKTRKKIEIKDLNDIELLLLEEGHCLRAHALAACRSDNISKTFRATSLPTLIQMVQSGFGATLLPEMMIKAKAVPDSITVQRFKSPAPTREIGFAWRKNHIKEADIEHLAEITVKAAKA